MKNERATIEGDTQTSSTSKGHTPTRLANSRGAYFLTPSLRTPPARSWIFSRDRFSGRGFLVWGCAVLSAAWALLIWGTIADAQNLAVPALAGTLEIHPAAQALADERAARINALTDTRTLPVAAQCTGFIDDTAPTLRILYQIPRTHEIDHQLLVETEHANTVALLINGPDGSWHCVTQQDARTQWLQHRPIRGQIDIWAVQRRPGTAELSLRVQTLAPTLTAPALPL